MKDAMTIHDEARTKICVSVAEATVEACMAKLRGVDLAEVRLDAVADLTLDGVRAIFGLSGRKIATCRPGQHPDFERARILAVAAEAGAAYVDVELDAADDVRREVAGAARAACADVIVSHHDLESTPGRQELRRLVDACFEAGGDVAKIACMARSHRDAARLLGLLDDDRRLVVIGMGEAGVVTRVAAPLLGGELTFACPSGGTKTAAGQLDLADLQGRVAALLYGTGFGNG